MPLDIVAA